jgi:2-deoxy-D-gluconate 3-dehydrogenase
MQIDLSGKVALVTGASRGIGAAAASALRAAGASVLGVSRAHGVDLLDRDQRARLPKDVSILVNCAGMQASHPALGYPPDVWDRELELNLTATLDLCQRLAPAMIERRWGRIVNFASIAGIQGTRGIVGYSVAKAGVVELTKCLSNEWSPFGVTVNCIAPGYIETEMLKPLTGNPSAAETAKGRIPVGRFGTPEEVASPVVFLCSDEARYITGVTLPVDGGWLAR